VTFSPTTDPLTAHDELAKVFGHKAGFGHFLFRADSTIPGRYWVQSVEPWSRWPEQATSALEPKRVVIQLAEGLMYRFTLPVCAGKESLQDKEKRVIPFESASQVQAWFNDNAPHFGVKPMMLDVSMQTLRFPHGAERFKVQHAVLEGALEVTHAERLRRRILKGFGYYRRTGLGMLQLSA
jgi:CRISPR-associated protein Cas6/Cse3/CasE subtype I-E